jgi:hypothetical protein
MANGTARNWLLHGALGALIGGGVTLALGPASGALVGAVYWWAKEAGEFSVKHWDAPGRPLADLWPFHPRRTRDDRLDLFSGWAGTAAGVAAAHLIPRLI